MVKVYQKDLPANVSNQDREYAFRRMFSIFKKAVIDAGILQEYKRREFYESPGEKKRRKKKEQKNQILKNKLRENFTEGF